MSDSTPPIRTHTLMKVLSFALIVYLLLSALTGRAVTPSTDDCRKYLTVYEGYRLTAYPDKDWTYSVGIGHNLGYGRPARMVYTRNEVESWFQSDLRVALAAAHGGVRDFDDLPAEVQLATLGLIWTVGIAGFDRFKDYRRAVSMRAFNAAAVSIYTSRWFYQVSANRANHMVRVLQSQP